MEQPRITPPQALIFDMDGTLWDALDTYVWCWNEAYRQCGSDTRLTRDSLLGYIGMEMSKILEETAPSSSPQQAAAFKQLVCSIQDEYLPQMGGKLYEGVLEGIAQLATRYQILLLSNCEKSSLPIFMNYTGLTPYISDYIAFGENHQPKHKNMQLLMERNQLTSALYVGDTEGDSAQSHLAGLPFVYLSHGFGVTDNYQLTFANFPALTHYFLTLE